MRVEQYAPGTPCWIDLGAPDVDAAAAFYSALFGWEVPPGMPEAGGYRVAMKADAAVAGLGPQQSPGPPYWTSYVAVDSADDAAAKIEANGGTVLVPPMDVLDVGRMAVFFDNVGAAISVWQPGQHIGAGLVDEPDTWSWNELMTTDVDASKTFYNAVFGWDAVTHEGGMMAYTEFQLAGRSIAGMMKKPPMIPAEVPPNWGVYFSVEDADATIDKIKELGGSLVMGPMDMEPGRLAVVRDPGGATFNIIKLKAERGG